MEYSDIMAFDEVYDSLLAALIEAERQRGSYCLTIIYLGNISLIRRLRRFGFIFRPTTSQLLVYVNSAMPELKPLFDANTWYLLDGDSDC